MGHLISFLKEQNASYHIKFIKDYLDSDKIECLKQINEDYFITEDVFNSFFLCESSYFKLFEINETGLINLFEIFLLIYILKGNSVKTKIESKNIFLNKFCRYTELFPIFK